MMESGCLFFTLKGYLLHLGSIDGDEGLGCELSVRAPCWGIQEPQAQTYNRERMKL